MFDYNEKFTITKLTWILRYRVGEAQWATKQNTKQSLKNLVEAGLILKETNHLDGDTFRVATPDEIVRHRNDI